MKRTEPLNGIEVKGEQVAIWLDRDGADWLASCLPERDGFTRDLLDALDADASANSGPSDGGST